MTTTTADTARALPTGTWNADPVHSDFGFSIDYMAGTFRGSFSQVDARVVDGRLEGSAEVARVQVKDASLEAHLQSPEFFDAERHPQLTFAAEDVGLSGSAVTIRGEITIKGHTEPVELRGTIGDPIADPYGNERFGLRLETTIDRTKFGIDWNAPLPTGRPALSNDVTLTADLQLVKSD
jgi:polyisoprenoid-binding protein YceI